MSERSTIRFSALGDGRMLVATSLVSSIGLGMYATGSLLFFTRVVGLSVTQVGLGLSIAGFAALAASIPAGRLADSIGDKRLAVMGGAAQTVLLVLAVLVQNFAQFAVVICATAIIEQAVRVARSSLVSAVGGPAIRVTIGAYMHSAFNLGVTGGIALAGVVIAVDSKLGYVLLMLGSASAASATWILTLLVRVPNAADREHATPVGWRALRDLPYVTTAVVYGLITITDVVLNVGLPLWIVTNTSVPKSFAALLIGVNTVLIVALQVRASVGATSVDAAGRRLFWAALLGAAATLLFALSANRSWQTSLALLAVAVVVLSAGELLSSPAATFLRYDLAAADAQGMYGGVFSLASGVRTLIGPSLVTLLMATWHGWGWAALAGVFVLLAGMTFPSISWAQRTRHRFTLVGAAD